MMWHACDDDVARQVDSMEDDVEQLLPPGSDRSLTFRHLAASPSPSQSPKEKSGLPIGRSFNEGGGKGGGGGGGGGRSNILERDVAKLFSERVELFTKLEFTQVRFL